MADSENNNDVENAAQDPASIEPAAGEDGQEVQGDAAQSIPQNVKVTPPEGDETITVTVEPNAELDLGELDLNSSRMDILGNDLIITNTSTGGQVVLAGMALLMFEEDVQPRLTVNNAQLSSEDVLSRIGEVGNLTVKDYIAVSSIKPPKTDEETDAEIISRADTESDSESTVSESLALAVKSQIQSQTPQETSAQSIEETEFTSNAPPFAVDEEGAEESEEESVQQASSSSSASSQAESEAEEEAPPEPRAEFEFTAILLQPQSTDQTEDIMGVDTRVYRGGGGSEASFFDPSADRQFSTEVINLPEASENLLIYADNPAIYSEVQMARDVEFTFTLPPGFEVSELTITGLPNDFSIVGLVRSGSDYIIEDPVLGDRNEYRLTVLYPIPSDDDFTLTLEGEAQFDPGSGLVAPDETTRTFELEQSVEVRDVAAAEDYSAFDADGNPLWVLANQGNSNRIISGFGNDTIYGGIGSDTILGGDGNDLFLPRSVMISTMAGTGQIR